MKTIRMSSHQTCRTFQTLEEARSYIQKFVPDVAFPEVVRIVRSGSNPQFGIMMRKTLRSKEVVIFEASSM
jgi:hypothetical protein